MQKSVIFVRKSLKIFKRQKIFWSKRSLSGEYRGAVHSICNLKYGVSKKIPIIFHYGSNYGYYFIIKELA